MNDVPAFVRTEDKSFIRDTTNRALLNTDTTALARHRAQRDKAASLTQRLHTLESELSDLKTKLDLLINGSPFAHSITND